jgi:putative transposase
MPRGPRLVFPETPHHVIQRGNRRQPVFFGPDDYRAYLAIAAREFAACGVEVWAYCLMPNHVHLVAVPGSSDALAKAVGRTHLRYTRRVNARERWTGFLWQGRFASFPMHDDYLLRCVRYIGLNPVRAGLVQNAADWPWSSVGAHLHGLGDALLTREPIVQRFGPDLAPLFEGELKGDDVRLFRGAISTSSPLGAAEWVKGLRRERAVKGHVPEVHVPVENAARSQDFPYGSDGLPI